MRRPDNEGAVVDMLLYARRIRSRLSGVVRGEFVDDDEDLQLALTFMVQVFGDAARLTSPDFRARHAQVPWQHIVGTRQRVVDSKLRINFDVVWQAATIDVPAVVEQLEAIVATEFPEED